MKKIKGASRFLQYICVLFLVFSPFQFLEAKITKKSRELIQKAKDAYLKGNYLTAKKYYQDACDMGDYLGCSGVGTLFERGQGVLQDFSKAYSYYSYACQNHDQFGCFSKQMLEKGENAVEMYSSACDDGQKEACLSLANIYYTGMGEPRDPKIANLYYYKACSLKSASGCFNLGLMYQRGDKDVDQNDDMALAYFTLARQYWEAECQKKNQSSCDILRSLDQFRVLD